MNFPFGGPDDYRQQEELERERREMSLEALAWASVYVITAKQRQYIAHLRMECGIGEKEFIQFMMEKEAAKWADMQVTKAETSLQRQPELIGPSVLR
jgi:hypothetical protein